MTSQPHDKRIKLSHFGNPNYSGNTSMVENLIMAISILLCRSGNYPRTLPSAKKTTLPDLGLHVYWREQASRLALRIRRVVKHRAKDHVSRLQRGARIGRVARRFPPRPRTLQLARGNRRFKAPFWSFGRLCLRVSLLDFRIFPGVGQVIFLRF